MATKRGDDPRKKVDTSKRPKVTAENTAKMTDYNKKAKAVNAAAGTKLADKDSPMFAKQQSYAKAKQPTNASSLNRESRLTAIAAEMKKEDSTFKNKAFETIRSKVK